MKKIVSIMLLASLVLVAGVCVAYYNTSSLGYDNNNIIVINNNEIKLLDYNIKYKDIKDKVDKLENALPSQYITI